MLCKSYVQSHKKVENETGSNSKNWSQLNPEGEEGNTIRRIDLYLRFFQSRLPPCELLLSAPMQVSEGPETLPKLTPSPSLRCAFFRSRLRERCLSQGLKLETQESPQFFPHTRLFLPRFPRARSARRAVHRARCCGI